MTIEALLQHPLAWATLLLAVGLVLLLPRGGRGGWWLGLVLTGAALGLIGARAASLGDWIANGIFGFLALVTVGSAVMTVTLRNPVYCAIWFALSLLATGGLFLLDGAQFLGVATVVVYAGAILVTFLFVLMLANPEGHAYYDRLSWEAPMSAFTGAVMVGLLSFAMAAVFQPAEGEFAHVPQVSTNRQTEILAPQHMAHLGRQLFSKHLVSVELAGVLLFVALVGTVAIVSETKTKSRIQAAGSLPREGLR